MDTVQLFVLILRLLGLVLSQSLCEGAGPFTQQALSSKSPDSVVVTLEKSHLALSEWFGVEDTEVLLCHR